VWLEGRCVSYGESLPYWPFRDLLRDWLGAGPDEAELRVRIGLRRQVERLFGDRVLEIYPYLGAVLGLALEPDAQARLQELSPEALQYRTFEVVQHLFERLAEDGAAIAIGDLDGTGAEATAARIAARHGVKAIGLKANVAVAAEVEAMVAEVALRLGSLDILVNNAGITRDALGLRLKDEDWQAVIEVNLTAAFRLARAALRGMVRRRRGRVIAIASVVGVTGNAGQANYAAAKAGLIGMAKSLAAETATRGITVNCIAPGLITTAMTDKLNDEQRGRIAAAIPMGRFGAVEDIAAAAVYLASAEAGYITGQTLHVNGGMAMV
jgi:3-oxoacyl-[acyl-carrier protein] reductase